LSITPVSNLDKRECDLWKRNSLHWEEIGDLPQAIYCLNRVIKASGTQDREALRARAEYRLQQGHLKKAADNFSKHLRLDPNDVAVIKKLTQYILKPNIYRRQSMYWKPRLSTFSRDTFEEM